MKRSSKRERESAQCPRAELVCAAASESDANSEFTSSSSQANVELDS
jgi:hypothetical protein